MSDPDGGTGTDPASDPGLVTDPWSRLRRGPDGLVPVIAQDWRTRDVLMLAWMDDEALARTLATGRATYWSRSRQEYWVKGASSGHTQHVREVRLDCDADAVLLLVEQRGAACHTGAATCFDDGLVDHDAALAARPPAAGDPR